MHKCKYKRAELKVTRVVLMDSRNELFCAQKMLIATILCILVPVVIPSFVQH